MKVPHDARRGVFPGMRDHQPVKLRFYDRDGLRELQFELRVPVQLMAQFPDMPVI